MEISGFYEHLFDTDWTTTPSFYDRFVSGALPVPGAPCALEPDFLQTGVMSGTTVIIGPSGFGSPCTVAPSLCSPGGCGAPGLGILGWIVDVSFGTTPGSGIVLPADGTSASDTAVSYMVTPGMPVTGGSCGIGDYTIQASYSSDETQADDCLGLSAFSGLRQGGIVFQDLATYAPNLVVAFREPVLNVQADSGGGVEVGPNGGGALNGLKLYTQGGSASIGVEVRDQASIASVGDVAFAWWTTAAGGPPGVLHGGAWLLQRFSRDMPACFRGPVAPIVFVFTPEAAFTTCQMAVPPVAAQYDVFWQGLIKDGTTGELRNTNRVRTTLY